METIYSNNNLIKLVIKWKYTYLIILFATILFAFIFSSPYFITPLYKSTAVIYPSNLIPYSSETPTEQMLQLAKSEDISKKIIKIFNFSEKYKVDTASEHQFSKLMNIYNDMVKIKKTEYESVIIEAYDSNPIVACKIAKEIVNLINLKARELQREKIAEVFTMYENQIQYKKNQIDSIEKRMQVLRNDYGILNYEIQIKEATKMSSKGNNKSNLIESLKKYGGEYSKLEITLNGELKSLNKIKTEFDNSYMDLNKELTYTNIVSNPFPADKKSYPIRWIILLISVFSTLMITTLIISFIEKFKKV